MGTRVGGPSAPPAPPKPDTSSTSTPDPTKVATSDAPDDGFDPEDAKQEYAWQNLYTTPSLSKGSEGNVASRSAGRSADFDKQTKNGKTTTARTTGNEQRETTTKTKTATNKKGATTTSTTTHTGKTRREGMTKEGNVILAGYNSVATKTYGDQMHLVHGKGPGGTTTDAYYQGPSFTMSGAANATASGWTGVDLNVDVRVDANLIGAGASITKDIPVTYRGQKFDVIVRLGASGNVGANGDLHLTVHLGADGAKISAGADGFAGAKGTLIGSAEVDMNNKELVGGELQVSFAAGVGAGASFDADLHHVHAHAYATAGVGVGVDLDGEVYAKNIAQAIPKIVMGR